MKLVPYTAIRPLFFMLLVTAILPARSMPHKRSGTAATPVEIYITASNNGILTCANTAVTLSVTSSESNAVFSWTGPGGFTASGPAVIVTQQGTYMVTAVSAEGSSTGSYSVVQAGALYATPFWKEQFTLPDGSIAVDTGAIRWASSHTGVKTTKFSVLNNEFIVNNSKQGKEGAWSSAVIDIAGKNKVSISVDLRSGISGNGSLENDTSSQGDYVKMYYRLNGGAEVLFCEKRGQINDNSQVNTTVSSELLTGSTLQVIIRSRASATDEYYYFDNIQLSPVEPALITAEAYSSQTITCTNSQVQLSGYSSSPGVVFNWTGPGGFTSALQNPIVTAAGTYNLQVTDPLSGCSASASATVAANTTPPGEISINNSGIINCLTGSVTISGSSSSSGVNYKWEGPNGYSASSSLATVMHGGQYTLTATNPVNGCTSSKSTIVTENTTAPEITIGNNGPITCSNPEVYLSVTSNSANASYLWLGEDFISDQPIAYTSIPGLYIITVTDLVTGCSVTDYMEVMADYSDCGARKVTTVATTNTTEQTLTGANVTSFTYKAYPNPVITNGTIEFTSPQSANTTVSLYNALGTCEKVLFKGNVMANRLNRVSVPATQLAAGNYYYIINSGGRSFTGKLVILK
jgi:hypothetical protein